MNDTDNRSPAEKALEGYLGSLRRNPPLPTSRLASHIVRRARWQRTIRAPLRAVGSLIGALADGVSILLGSGQRGQR